MKAIFFTKYTRKGASSRLRTFQYLSYFKEAGIEVTVAPFFNDAYLEEVYRSKTHNKWLALKSFLRRMLDLTRVLKYDRVVIEKELFPYFPAVFEWILKVIGVKYIVDYDDAIFHNYDISPNPFVRQFLGKKIKNVMRYASVVVAGNEYLAQNARSFGARKVVVIPTVIDLTKYTLKDYSGDHIFTIGWIGSPITFKYLSLLKPVFESLSKRFKFRIVYIGANSTLGMPIEEIIPWREEEEVQQIKLFDVGIMPLEDNIWERGKCGYKLIQYMGCGVPVIGTPIGVNATIIEDGFNGFKAATLDAWEKHLAFFITNPSKENERIGLNGRRFIEQYYSLQVHQMRWLELLQENR